MTSSVVPIHLDKRRGARFVSGVGLLLATFELWHWFKMKTLVGKLMEATLPLCLALGLIYAGYWLSHTEFDDQNVARIITWFLIGIVSMTLVTAWVIGHQLIRELRFDHIVFVTINTFTVGGVGGFIIGVYDAKSKVREDQLMIQQQKTAREQEKLAFLNRLLRHNLLNGMNIVLGRAGSLETHVDAEGVRYLETIQTQSEDIVTLIQKIRTFTHATAEQQSTYKTVDLTQILEKEIAKLRVSYVDAVVTATVPEAVYVQADELLSEVFENVLVNAVQHNDKQVPQITVTAEDHSDSVIVVIGDNGPGIPDERKETIFTWQENQFKSTGSGIGLALTNGLVTQYGGSIKVEDNGSSGALFRIELPKPQAKAAQSRDSVVTP